MFLWEWFKDTLSYLGLYNKSNKILFMGLDNAGITTILHALKDDGMAQHEPTITMHPTLEEFLVGDMRFTTCDLSSHPQPRRVWKDFLPTIDAIVFLVDAWDRCRFQESKNELDSWLIDESISNCPVLILGNKIDKPGAATEDEILNFFGLYQLTTEKDATLQADRSKRPLEVFMCSVAKGQGYDEGFRWLAHKLSASYTNSPENH